VDTVVPFAVEVVAVEVDGSEILIGDFEAGWVGVGVELAADGEPGGGRGGGDEADDDGVTDEWLAAPVLADEREEAMLDLG
jgi:hypothetical protein